MVFVRLCANVRNPRTFLIENRSLRLAGRSLASAGLPGDEFGGDELHVGRVRGVERRVDRAAGELGIGLRGGDEHRVDVALDEFVDAAALALRVASRQVDDQRPFAFGCSGFELVGEFGEVWVREVGHDDASVCRGAGLEGSGDGVGW